MTQYNASFLNTFYVCRLLSKWTHNSLFHQVRQVSYLTSRLFLWLLILIGLQIPHAYSPKGFKIVTFGSRQNVASTHGAERNVQYTSTYYFSTSRFTVYYTSDVMQFCFLRVLKVWQRQISLGCVVTVNARHWCVRWSMAAEPWRTHQPTQHKRKIPDRNLITGPEDALQFTPRALGPNSRD